MNILDHASYSASDVTIESREPIFRGFIQVEKVSFRHRLFNQPDYSSVIQRELIHRPEAAGVLLYNDQQQRFALIEQFRVGALNDTDSAWQLEIIAGVLDGDEAPEDCIRRESLEESGCEVQQLQHLFSFYPSAGACSEFFHLYAAEVELPKMGGIFGMPDEGENIQLHLFDYSELGTLLKNGRLRNAPVIMALQWLAQHLQQR
ncbi:MULTISPECIES: NUDIX domain-containing protein [unclassified Acinetobacter]|uniref:ADP-ribose pyrophosphatase n=1 Tax=Acinetobacter corruptisaponis TaxID=3045147 RepID=A0ABY8RZ37_9GAMM|nr:MULTISPECIES: NUDIX domain-containing protein [unclassified Acinetobacter]MDH0031678.1 NUDIX domain-containing protein [Acinetobacter sp. GD04021]MDH0887477.1 NUDIX domain-containing protein [Acinetobacter sp. GD03873]MDH1083818.1 NUDIX domain-containing protein [Acinetobacter sp. GD03983]MDH2190793.1 NUDIX domain-containing protein [Acinetobacter sp. GD03645]MDH2204345.1 NUDIX domain-containing protein [Acinetobacter sp. GD03647]